MKKHKKFHFDNPDLALEAGLNALHDNHLTDLPAILTSTYPHRYHASVTNLLNGDIYAEPILEERTQDIRCIHSDNLWVLLLAAADISQPAFTAIIHGCEKDSELMKLIADFMPRYKDTYATHWDKEAVKGLIRASAVQKQSPTGAEKHAVRMGYNHPTIAAGLMNVDGISDDLRQFLEGIADLQSASNLPDPTYLTRQFMVDLLHHIEQTSKKLANTTPSFGSDEDRHIIATALGDAKLIEKSNLTPYDKLCKMVIIITDAHNKMMDKKIQQQTLQSLNGRQDGLHDLFTIGNTLHQLNQLGIDVGYDPHTRLMKTRLDKPDHYRGATLIIKQISS